MENGNNKKGLIISLAAIVAVVALAAIGYNVLKGGQDTTLPSIGVTPAANSASAGSTVTNAEAADGASGGNSAAAESGASATNSEYPIFTDFNIKTLEGSDVALSSFYGKPTLLGFWATWCPPCNAEAPEIQKLWERYGDQVNFVMVDSSVADGRDSPKSIQSWMEDGSYSYPVYYDETGEAAFVTEVYYLPTMYVLDSEGHLLTAFSGTLDVASGSQLIEQLLAL